MNVSSGFEQFTPYSCPSAAPTKVRSSEHNASLHDRPSVSKRAVIMEKELTKIDQSLEGYSVHVGRARLG
jgi:hypothetical protein